MTEDSIEQWVIELLQKQGYDFVHGPDLMPDAETDAPFKRESLSEVLLSSILHEQVTSINSHLPADVCLDAIRQIERIGSPELLVNNQLFHKYLTEDIPVTVQRDGKERGDLLRLIDFANPKNNRFHAINQFTIASTGSAGGVTSRVGELSRTKRPDLILFVNGLPLVVIELKSAVSEQATIHSAWLQLQTYKDAIPGLFTYNGFMVISDGLEARAGTISSGMNRFMAWKTKDGLSEASHLNSQLETLVQGMLQADTLLDLLRHFIVFESHSTTYSATGLTQVRTIKKLGAYHQYYAVNKAVESTIRAAGFKRDQGQLRDGSTFQSHTSAMYGLEDQSKSKLGDRKAGVVWHTQGSGKSLSMVFYTGKIVLALDNPTILVITDRNDLDDQLFDTFAASRQLLRQEPVQAKDRVHLKELLKVASGGVVFTTIQKFQPSSADIERSRDAGARGIYETLSERQNIVVIADEAHRTQYGFTAKSLDEKDADGNVIGKKTVYGFAKYMRDALPNATYLGFTGTPVEGSDKNTPAVFGNYVDIYDIAQAVDDGATVRIYYESRLAKIKLSDEGQQLVKDLDDELASTELSTGDAEGQGESQKAKAKWTRLEALIGSEERKSLIAKDIIDHFEKRQAVFAGKAMIVAMSRRIAAELYDAMIKLRPDWHNADLNAGAIKVVMTASSADGPMMSRHHTTKDQRRILADRMKDPDNDLKIVIVRDMWLTGFDVPCLNTLYIDKPMKGHNLMQAIARVNRIYKDKTGGLVVDYLGIASDLKEALSFYSDSGGKGDPAATQEEAVSLMLEKLEVVSQMFHQFAYEDYFNADTRKKLQLILAAEDHILGLEDGKQRYINEVTALSKALAIALPHDQAMDAKEEIAFFQAVKARLVKFQGGSERTHDELETAIRQVIDKALISDQVIDIFDAAGLKKPDISILSDEFLDDLKNHKHKNLALETLRKLLNDEIKGRSKYNLVQSKSLLEMLEDSIKRYHNKVITSGEVIEELIKLAKDIREQDKEPEEMGLTKFEYAFYCAVANNESARELMGKEKLRELAVVLHQEVRNKATIDWTVLESVRSGMKVAIKRILRRFGYPPDMQLLATETILKQAEMIAEELAG
ncbi:MAG: type I restriction endonuclease subunit R [Leptospiraceae bacterium]|nr:type I restriction endonuclease subunit R [Leptospiraceae bacterium]